MILAADMPMTLLSFPERVTGIITSRIHTSAMWIRSVVTAGIRSEIWTAARRFGSNRLRTARIGLTRALTSCGATTAKSGRPR